MVRVAQSRCESIRLASCTAVAAAAPGLLHPVRHTPRETLVFWRGREPVTRVIPPLMTVMRKAAAQPDARTSAVPYDEPLLQTTDPAERSGADVPGGVSDSERPAPRELAVLLRDHQIGLRGDPLAFDGPVDGGAADAEELGYLEGAVLATVHQGDQVRFLLAVELGLLTAEPALGPGDLHALDCAQPDEVGLDSATIARTLNSNRPTASVGS